MEKSIPKKDIWQLWEWKKYFLSYCTVYGSTSQLSSRIYIVWQQSRYGKDILISIFILETSSLACISYRPLFPKHGTVYFNTWILRLDMNNLTTRIFSVPTALPLQWKLFVTLTVTCPTQRKILSVTAVYLYTGFCMCIGEFLYADEAWFGSTTDGSKTHKHST